MQNVIQESIRNLAMVPAYVAAMVAITIGIVTILKGVVR